MPPASPRRRRWLPILAGAAILIGFLVVGGIFAAVMLVRENLDVEAMSDGTAASEFDKVRARFPGRPPLVELAPGGRPRYTQDSSRAPAAGTQLETLHVLAWDPDEGKLARLSLPFWLLRMKSTPIQLSAYTAGLDDEDVQLSPAEIEKYGPGIVFDHATSSGGRVLFWAQ